MEGRREHEESTSGTVLVFDGDCGLCRGVARILIGLGLARESDVVPLQRFEGEELLRLEAAGIRNELAAIERQTGRIRVGLDGLLWALDASWARPCARLFALAPLRLPLTALYRTIAYNRRFLSVPQKTAPRCTCEPDPSRLWNAVFQAVIVTLALLEGISAGRAATGAVVGLLLSAVPVAVLAPPAARLRTWMHVATQVASSGLVLFLVGPVETRLAPGRGQAPTRQVLLAAFLLWTLARLPRRFRFLEARSPWSRALFVVACGALGAALTSP